MSEVAIRVEGLGKQYKIGKAKARYGSFRESITETLTSAFRRFHTNGNGYSGSTNGSSHHSSLITHHSESADSTIWALKDVSFSVKRGEVVGIIGRNGAGKSTLLKILSRITEPTEGAVDIYGRVGSLLEVGTGFHPELTGRENIYLNGSIIGMKRVEIQKKFDEIVAFAEIEKFIDTPVKHYSSGMYVRLAFAVAAHLEPEILLVDEVLAVGDLEFQKKCLGKMQDVAKAGQRTVVFVSHNIAAIRRVCSSAMLLRDGCVIKTGVVDTVLARYMQKSVNHRSAGELISEMHVTETSEFRITHITLHRKNGEPTSRLCVGEKFAVYLRFEVRQLLRQVRIGVGFNTCEGTRVATLHHTDDGCSPIDLENGAYEMSFTLANPLLPGTYVLSVGAHRARLGATLDYVPEAMRFQVLDVSENGRDHEPHNSGLVNFCATWSEARLIN